MTTTQPDLQDLARRAVIAKLVADEARGFADRAATLAGMLASGARTVDAIGPDGAVYGTVSRCAGRKTAEIVDDGAFFAWVLEHHPDRIIRLIDPAWRKQLLDMAARLGDPVEAGTGQVIPGLRIVPGDPYVAVRTSAEGRDRMRQAMDPQRGVLFALPAPTPDTPDPDAS